MAAALLGALYGSPVIALDTPLTLPEAQRLAVARSGQLAAQQYAVTAAREMAVAAGQLPDPVATLGVNNLPINGPDAWSFTRDFMTMTSVGVMQEFTGAEKRAARAERFDREANKALAEKNAKVAAIQRDTALAWLDRYYAEAMQAVIAEQRRQAEGEIPDWLGALDRERRGRAIGRQACDRFDSPRSRNARSGSRPPSGNCGARLEGRGCSRRGSHGADK